MQGSDAAPGPTADAAEELGRHIDGARSILESDEWYRMQTTDLAGACAQLKVALDDEENRLDAKIKRLNDALRSLNERMTTECVSQIRVNTNAGRRLVFQRQGYYVSVLAENRERVRDWLKQHAPELVKEAYNETSFRSYMRKAQMEGEGEFPAELVDDGTIRVTTLTEIAFRKSD